MVSGISKIISTFKKERFTFLLFSLILYSMAAPFIDTILKNALFSKLLFFLVLLSAVVAVSDKKKSMHIVLLLSVLSAIAFVLDLIYHTHDLSVLSTILKLLFNACMVYMIVDFFYHCHQVTRDTICAALIGFMLIMLVWTDLYFLLELANPDSFNVAHDTIFSDPGVLRYFSFVTITTLGYGDVVPVSHQARNLAVLEAFIGQIYLAVLIARLVAIHTAQEQNKT